MELGHKVSKLAAETFGYDRDDMSAFKETMTNPDNLKRVIDAIVSQGDKEGSGANHKLIIFTALIMEQAVVIPADIRERVLRASQGLQTTKEAKKQFYDGLKEYKNDGSTRWV